MARDILSQGKKIFVIFITILIGLILQVLPIPCIPVHIVLEWPLLILIYWCITLPKQIGIISASFIGLIVDSNTGSLLGQHILAYVICAYLINRKYQALKLFPWWKQLLSILGFLLIERIISAFILSFSHNEMIDIFFWTPTVLSIFLWPWIFIILRKIQHRFYII